MSWFKRFLLDPIRKWFDAMGNRLVPTKEKPEGELVAPQIERALNWIWFVFFVGLVVIGLLALGRPEGARLHFFATSALAGICALGAGSAFGLLFGLPTSSGRVTVVAANPVSGAPGTAGAPAATPHATAEDDWYRDNTSLEQIAQWLTTAIVALSLANFNGWVNRFDHVAKSVTCAMYAPAGAPTGPAAVSPVGAQPAPPAAARLDAAAPVLGCRASDGVPGGLLLASYAIFGFVAGYLWSRRYLMGEFAGGRKEMRARIAHEVRVAEERSSVERARADHLVQAVPRSAAGPAEMEIASARAAERPSDGLEASMVTPGSFPDDPWRGQFGGKNSDGRVELVATVSELTTLAGLYQVEIRLRGIDSTARAALANHPARIYLHPTFPDPIRTVSFDMSGELRLPLVAYGAFTVGAQFERDSRLELNLAALPDVPEQFRSS